MRVLAAAIILLAATSVAGAQCAIGSFPSVNENGETVCQSPAGQTPPSSGFSPGGIVNCPVGTTVGVDSWGNRTCSSLVQQPQQQGLGPQVTPPTQKKRFEISKKCPQCK